MNAETVKKVGPIITFREVRAYEELLNIDFDTDIENLIDKL